MTAKPICLSHPDRGLCQDRRAGGRPGGWLPHFDDPGAGQRLLGAESPPTRGGAG